MEEFAALENQSIESPKSRLTVLTHFVLQPNYTSLYHHSLDEVFQYQNSLLTEQQYKAVCSFLGFSIDISFFFRYYAGKALKWGWNKYEHPALKKSRDFYYQMGHHQFPPSQNPAIESLTEDIRQAFESRHYPGDDNLHCKEFLEREVIDFRGMHWQSLHPDFLEYYCFSLPVMSQQAFMYFLPAYLINSLNNLKSYYDWLTRGLVWYKDVGKFDALEAFRESGLPESKRKAFVDSY